uniref:Zinc finger protein 383-like n=1 Tax=Geotrypetes seraphini TaxID=260995 RepID=A0A6P8Q1N3_GEOSA|nr:zinc finger protein 383-like [Geotrypetes seraphini]
MPVGASARMQVTFEEVSFSFSQEEWEYLDDEQKELYREVMKENYQTIISLGTGSPTFTPKIISYIERGEEPYIRDEPVSEEKETEKSSCSADHQIRHQWKRIKNQREDPVEMEQIQTQSETTCETISQGTEKINTKNCEQESKEQKHPAGDAIDGVTICERNERELSNIPQDKSHLAERPFQINNSGNVASEFLPGKKKGKNQKKELKKDHKNEKLFTSAECNKSSTQLSILKIHQQTQTAVKPFICTQCNKCFTRLQNLKIHHMIHTGHKPYTCTECKKSFTHFSTLKNHKMIHTGYKPYTCTECNKSFICLSNLTKHQRTHTGHKPYICTECNKSFNRLHNLKIHHMIHTGHKPYTCTECNKSFTCLSHLKRHKLTHTDHKPFTCTECNKSFTQLSNLKEHQVIHTGYKPYTCTECNKSFTCLSHLKRHKLTHTDHKPYTCTECNKSFTQLSSLKSHKMIHTGPKSYTCTECNKSFTCLSHLKKHKLIHKDHKPFTRTECNKSFTQLSNLKEHQVIHTGYKPFTCSECNKSFTCLSHLKRHKLIHTDHKPFTSDQQIRHESKRIKNQREDPVEMEQIQTQSENVSVNISQRPGKINTKNCKQESKEKKYPTGDTRDGIIQCERNERELSNIPEDKIHIAERPFQIPNSDKVTSTFLHSKRKGEKHQKELLMCKRNHKNDKKCTASACCIFTKSRQTADSLKEYVRRQINSKITGPSISQLRMVKQRAFIFQVAMMKLERDRLLGTNDKSHGQRLLTGGLQGARG